MFEPLHEAPIDRSYLFGLLRQRLLRCQVESRIVKRLHGLVQLLHVKLYKIQNFNTVNFQASYLCWVNYKVWWDLGENKAEIFRILYSRHFFCDGVCIRPVRPSSSWCMSPLSFSLVEMALIVDRFPLSAALKIGVWPSWLLAVTSAPLERSNSTAWLFPDAAAEYSSYKYLVNLKGLYLCFIDSFFSCENFMENFMFPRLFGQNPARGHPTPNLVRLKRRKLGSNTTKML